MKHKPAAPTETTQGWFKCHVCRRKQTFAPEEQPGGITVEAAEAGGWRWSALGWLCPAHRNWEPPSWGLVLSFFATVAASVAGLAFRSAAIAWCWNVFVKGALWERAPHVQTWAVLALLLVRSLVEYRADGGSEDEDELLSDKFRAQRSRVVSHLFMTALSWGSVALLVRIFN